jgi:hypothetical protein
MKIVLPNSPTFVPAAAGASTLTFANTPNFQIGRLLAVINQTANVLIYAASVANTGYASYNGFTKQMVLQTATTGQFSTDTLICIYDDPAPNVSIASLPSLPAGSNAIGDVNADYQYAGASTISSANTFLSIPISTRGTVAVAITGTWTGTLTFSGSVDGTLFVPLSVYNLNTQASAASVTATNTTVQMQSSGFSVIRIQSGTPWTGSAAFTIRAASGIYQSPSAEVEIKNDSGNPIPISAPSAIPISATTLPLPTSAAKDSTLTDGTQKTQVTALPALSAGSNTVGNVGLIAGTQSIGNVGLNAGTNQIGFVNPDKSNNGTPVSLASLGATSGNISASSRATVTFFVTGTWVGSIWLEVQNPNTGVFTQITDVVVAAGAMNGILSEITINGMYYGSVAGIETFRFRMNAYTSGTANIYYVISNNQPLNAITRVQGNVALYPDSFSGTPSTGTLYSTTANSFNLTAFSAGSCTLYGIYCNPNPQDTGVGLEPLFLKVYSKPSPTVGGANPDIPILVIPIIDERGVTAPPFQFPANGIYCNTGASFALTRQLGPNYTNPVTGVVDALPPTNGGHQIFVFAK